MYLYIYIISKIIILPPKQRSGTLRMATWDESHLTFVCVCVRVCFSNLMISVCMSCFTCFTRLSWAFAHTHAHTDKHQSTKITNTKQLYARPYPHERPQQNLLQIKIHSHTWRYARIKRCDKILNIEERVIVQTDRRSSRISGVLWLPKNQENLEIFCDLVFGWRLCCVCVCAYTFRNENLNRRKLRPGNIYVCARVSAPVCCVKTVRIILKPLNFLPIDVMSRLDIYIDRRQTNRDVKDRFSTVMWKHIFIRKKLERRVPDHSL